MTRPVLLAILDGLGLREEWEGNAFLQAKTPTLDGLMAGGYGRLDASGMAVGLPEGQMGNSEVGHLNIGAGRVVLQDLVRITRAVDMGELDSNPTLIDLAQTIKARGRSVHLMGLLSQGGVHSHRDHLYGLLRTLKDLGIKEAYVHAFFDGRDVSPTAGLDDLRDLLTFMEDLGFGQLASMVGRYYAMDRDKRAERTQAAYDLQTLGLGIPMTDPLRALEDSYKLGVTDEFVKPHVALKEGRPLKTIGDGDGIIFYNFRPDRARQLVRAYLDEDIPTMTRSARPKDIYMATMVDYDPTIQPTHIIFDKEDVDLPLGQVISQAGLRQLRIAETEKYPHVTFFLNGGREEAFEGEDRILVPSPKVATYDLQPEMSARGVKEALVRAIKEEDYGLIVLNFANPDMVGHTGDLQAAIQAIETVDACLEEILQALADRGGQALITSDHGNSETMIDEAGNIVTSHTTNQVMLVPVGDFEVGDGVLADLAPTLLELMGLDQPDLMTGKSLIVKD